MLGLEEGHHLRCQGEFQCMALTWLEQNPLEADQMVQRNNGRSFEVAQVKLGNFAGGLIAGILYGDADVQIIPGFYFGFVQG